MASRNFGAVGQHGVKLLCFAVVLATSASCVDGTSTIDIDDTSVLRVAMISDLQATSKDESTFSTGLKFGMQYIRDHMGGMSVGGASGPKLRIEVIEYDSMGDSSSSGQVADMVALAVNGSDMNGNPVGDIDVIVAATSSTNVAVIDNAQSALIPNIHAGGGNPAIWTTDNNYAFGMHLPFPEYTKGPMKLFQLYGMKTIGIIRSESFGFAKISTVHALKWAQQANLTVVGPTADWCSSNADYYRSCTLVDGNCRCGEQDIADQFNLGITVTDGPTFYEIVDDGSKPGPCTASGDCSRGLHNTNLTNFHRRVIQDMKKQGVPDVLLNFAHGYHNVVQAMVEEEFAPKVVVGWQGGTTTSWAIENTGTLQKPHGYWNVGFGQWHKAMSYTDPVFGSTAKAVENFESADYSAFHNGLDGSELGYDTAGGVGTAVVLYQALKQYVDADFVNMSKQERRDAIRNGIGDMNDETMWGVVRFNRYNQNNGRGTAAFQIVADTTKWPVPDAEQLCILPSEAAETSLVVPFATWESRFTGCPNGTYNSGAECEPCQAGKAWTSESPGFFVDGEEPLRNCEECEQGKYHDDIGGATCLDCSTNSYASATGMSACTQCSAGRMQHLTGRTSCYNCAKGTFSNLTLDECEPCAAGTYADSTGMEVCFECPAGKAIGEPGQSACINCALGKIAMTMGMVECDECPGDLTTQYPGSTLSKECQCPEGKYRDKTDRTVCHDCPEGMTCAFGSDEINWEVAGSRRLTMSDAGPTTPQLQSGFFSAESSPLSVYKCPREDICSCPGGDPGECSGEGDKSRVGLLCFDCQEGFVRTECGCEECSPISKVGIVMLPIIAFGGCIILYYLGNSAYSTKGSISLTFFIFAGLVVTVLWLCAIMNDLAVPWPSAQKSVFKTLSVFSLNPDALALECGIGTDPVLSYTLRCILPLAIILAVVICFGISKVVAFAKPSLGWDINKSINTIGAIFQAMFILIVVIAVTPLNHYSHPNGRQSLVTAPTVMYGEYGDWEVFLGLGLAVLMVFVVPFFAITAWATVKAPQLMTQESFPIRFRFWLYRFRPDCWWWGILLNVRQVLLAFVSSVPADDPHSQSTYFVIVLGAYLILQTRYWPWKNHELNMAEASLMALVMFMMKAVTAFMPTSTQDHHSELLTFFMVLVVVEINIICAMIGWAFYNKVDLGAEFSFRTGENLQEKLAVQWCDLVDKCRELGDGETKSIVKCMNAYDVQNVLQSINAFHAAAPETFPQVKTDSLMSDMALARVISTNKEKAQPESSNGHGASQTDPVPEAKEPEANEA